MEGRPLEKEHFTIGLGETGCEIVDYISVQEISFQGIRSQWEP